MRSNQARNFGVLMLLTCILVLSSTVSSLGKTRLEFWGFTSLVRGEKEIIERFQASHPDIEVAFVPVAEAGLRDKIVTAVIGGVPPAVTIVPNIESLALEGVLLPLDDLLKQDKTNPEEIWVKNALDASRINGKLYALNQTIDVRAMFYNKSLFAAAGYNPNKPPTTWEELATFSKRLTKVGGDGKISQLGFTPLTGQGSVYYFALQNGAKFISEDGHKALLTDSELKDSVNFMKFLYDSLGGYNAVEKSPAAAGNEFLNQTMAMTINGNWTLNTMALDKRADGLEWGVAPTPVPSERLQQMGRFAGLSQYSTWSGGWRYAIPASFKDIDVAWELLKYLTSVEGLLANSSGEYADAKAVGQSYVPRFTANMAADRYLANKYLPFVDKSYQDAQWFFISQLSYTTSRPKSPALETLISTLSNIGLQALRDGKNPDQVFADAQAKVQSELDSYFGGK